MNDLRIIDAHSHLWLKQDTVVDGMRIRALANGRSEFMGELRQMLPPFMIDGKIRQKSSCRIWIMHRYRLP